MALLDRIAVPVTVYPRTAGATPDGDVGQQITEGAPVVLSGYVTPASHDNDDTPGQGYSNTARLTLRSIGELDPVTLRHARYVANGREYFAQGEPEYFGALRNPRHWSIRLMEVGPSA